VLVRHLRTSSAAGATTLSRLELHQHVHSEVGPGSRANSGDTILDSSIALANLGVPPIYRSAPARVNHRRLSPALVSTPRIQTPTCHAPNTYRAGVRKTAFFGAPTQNTRIPPRCCRTCTRAFASHRYRSPSCSCDCPFPAAAGTTVLVLPVGGLTVNISATVEKAKGPTGEKFFIPSRTRGYVIQGRHARSEFRHDSCNTAPR
jgi:hypothetical protein